MARWRRSIIRQTKGVEIAARLGLHRARTGLGHPRRDGKVFLVAVLDVQGSPVVRAWNVVHMLSKMLSPAAEAFRNFVLEQGETFLAGQFGRHMPMPATNGTRA